MPKGLALMAAVLCLAALGQAGVEVSPARSAAAIWPAPAHDAQNSGVSPYLGPEPPVTAGWSFLVPDPNASPSAAVIDSDGVIYVGGQGVHALDPDGSLRWSYPRGTFPAPVVGAGGAVYALDGVDLVALRLDGTEAWRFRTAGRVNSPAIGIDGTVYLPSAEKLYAISPDGYYLWGFSTPAETRAAVGADGTIYLDSGNQLHSTTPDGRQNWQIELDGGASHPAVGPEGTIFISGMNVLNAVNPDGTMKWRFDFPEVASIDSRGALSYGTFPVSSPAFGPGGDIYAAWHDALFCITTDGEEAWRFSFGASSSSGSASPTVDANGTIYIGSDDKKVYALNPDGTEKWRFGTGGAIRAPVAIGAGGTVYASSQDSRLYAIVHGGPGNRGNWFLPVSLAIAAAVMGGGGFVLHRRRRAAHLR